METATKFNYSRGDLLKYGTFIFDFDFTLADATKGIVESMNFAFNKLGLAPRNSDEIKKTVGMTLKDAFFVLTNIDGGDAVPDDFVRYFKEKADEIMTKNTVLFADTITTLNKLKANGCKTAIVTSKFHYRIVEVLAKYKISRLIDCIIGFEDVAQAKPSPEGFLKAMSELSVTRENVLYIGDSVIDANTAVNAGVDFAAVTTGTTDYSDFEPYPHKIIAAGLTELFEKIFCCEGGALM
jgi:phosphoglycolate phosphatase